MFFKPSKQPARSRRSSPLGALVSLVVLSQLALSAVAGLEDGSLTKNSLDEAQNCLAMNIYHEARGEPIEGILAVAQVTMNRVASKHYPNTVCEVVWQPRQFSWTNYPGSVSADMEQSAWQDALEIADLFLHGARWDKVGQANHYHNTKVDPYWRNDKAVIARLGNHIFYHL